MNKWQDKVKESFLRRYPLTAKMFDKGSFPRIYVKFFRHPTKPEYNFIITAYVERSLYFTTTCSIDNDDLFNTGPMNVSEHIHAAMDLAVENLNNHLVSCGREPLILG